ncbi:hypothetical protein FHS43_006820 [Streptosporangium becharense]|uniref:Uncharacterized protein n=1 Tax=Streptosporangium becharense TaxID=1816182 RepID=A0A7W9IJ56_9ACTN|nr:hypothetical protein [Streptosporangium becharense]MBB2915499.1 hypothetical protein [Streptosporangium becharense]MBB5821004.1 hypothetical protein [Streptosporangium becharense]
MFRRFLVSAALLGCALIAPAAVALPASAATGSWTVSKTHYTIYFDGGYATMLFNKPVTSLPNNGQITSTTVQVAPYTNGRTTETITICYQKLYTATDYLCTTPVSITGNTTFSVSAFNGLDPKGTVTVRHTLSGGTYPATGVGVQDTVTVNYQY